MIQINMHTNSPFNMSDAYMEINVGNHYPINVSDSRSLLKEIYQIIKDHEIVIINDNIDSLALGLYDPKGKFNSYPLKNGNYLSPEDFRQNNSYILAKEDSFVHNYSIDNNNIYDFNRETYKVKGIYDFEHPLYTENHEYIYNYFESEDLRGRYYIDTEDENLINRIMDLLIENKYTCNIIRHGSKKSPSDIIKKLINNSSYMAMLIGTVFIYFNFHIFYLIFLKKYYNVFIIHLMFGATKLKLLFKYSKMVILNLFIGSTVGIIFYQVAFQGSKLSSPIWLLGVAFWTNMILSYLIYTIAFSRQKYSKGRLDYGK